MCVCLRVRVASDEIRFECRIVYPDDKTRATFVFGQCPTFEGPLYGYYLPLVLDFQSVEKSNSGKCVYSDEGNLKNAFKFWR